MEIKDTDRCANCYKEFADHNYVPDSIDQYKCPVPVTHSGYGFFSGGDPRNFFPDHESCSPEEIANHKRACEAAEKHGLTDLECPSFFFKDDNGNVGHVLKAPFGIGSYTIEMESYFEPLEERDPAESWDEG